MKTNKIFSIGLILTIVLLSSLCACSKKEESTTSSQNDKVNIEIVEQLGENPLTGLSIDEKDEKNRPIGVMINNISQAQPLLGVSQADIMYECLVEGGITRILALFQNPISIEKIGSVRSARPPFINIALGHDAIYCHIGGSTEATQMLKSNQIDSFDLGVYQDMMWRDQTRMNNLGYEHSALTSGKKLINGIENHGTRTTLKSGVATQKFSDNSPVKSGQSANQITAGFSTYKTTSFNYDKEKNAYLISQFGSAQLDGNNGEQNSKANVLILNVNSRVSDDEGHVALDLLNSSGTGKYFYGGKYIDIKWSKKSANSQIKYQTADGNELALAKGQIYVCMVPLDADITIH